MPITIRTSDGSATVGRAPNANPAAAANWAPKRTGIGRPRTSSRCETATSAAAGSTTTSGVCRIAKPEKMPAIIAMPPERGTGLTCSERWLGTSSGQRSCALSIPAMSSSVTSAETIGETGAISGIATHLVRSGKHGAHSNVFRRLSGAHGLEPARRLCESRVERVRGSPIEQPARSKRVDREIARQAPDFVATARDDSCHAQKRERCGKESCRLPERAGDARRELGGRNALVVAEQKGPACGGVLGKARERVDEIADVDQAAAVAHAREGQGQSRIDPTEQTQKVGLDLGSIYERRPDGRELDAHSGCGFGQGPLRFELGAAVGVLRIERVVLSVRPAARILAVHLHRAQENETADGSSGGFREPGRPGAIDAPPFPPGPV